MNIIHKIRLVLLVMSLGLLPLAQAEEDKLALPQMSPELGVTSDVALGTNDQGIGLAPGDTVANFTINNVEGEPVTWQSLQQQAPLLVVFYRGGWCPYCNVQIRQLTLAYPEFEKRGILPVLISVDETDGTSLAQRTYEIPFPVLSDPDLEAWSHRDHHKIAVSSAFFVDPAGTVKWAHSSRDYRTRPSPDQLLEVADTIDW